MNVSGHTPTVVKTSCSLLTRLIKVGSLTLTLRETLVLFISCKQRHRLTSSPPAEPPCLAQTRSGIGRIGQKVLKYRDCSEQIVEERRRVVVRKELVDEDWDEPAQCGPKLFSQMLSLLGVETRRGRLCWIDAAGVASRLQRFHQLVTGVARARTRILGCINSMQSEES